jgi:hypothetical protein
MWIHSGAVEAICLRAVSARTSYWAGGSSAGSDTFEQISRQFFVLELTGFVASLHVSDLGLEFGVMPSPRFDIFGVFD